MSASAAHVAAYTAAALLILAPLLITAVAIRIANRRRERLDDDLAALERIWQHPAATRRNTRKEDQS